MTTTMRETEVGLIPEEWRIETVGALFDAKQGKALSPKARECLSPKPFLRTSNLFWGGFNLDALDEMDFSVEEFAKLNLRFGDLLVCEGGDIGRSAVWKNRDISVSFQNHIHRLRIKNDKQDEVISDFVMYWLWAAFVYLKLYGGVGNKTTIPNLSGTRLKSLAIPLPSLPEQRAIAGVLSKLQSAIETQRRIVATLKELKATTMAKLFREGTRGEPLKQTEIGEIPESWAVIRLGDHCSMKSGGTPSRQVAEFWRGTIPWVKTGEINYNVILDTEEKITEQGLRNSSARVFPKGTLLMAMYGQGVTRGRVAILGLDAATNQACAAFFPDEGIEIGFLYAFFSHAYERIRMDAHGANQQNLSADLIANFRVPLPSLPDEQEKIATIVQKLDEKIQVENQKVEMINRLFSSLLHLFMTGEVRVTPQMIKEARHVS